MDHLLHVSTLSGAGNEERSQPSWGFSLNVPNNTGGSCRNMGH